MRTLPPSSLSAPFYGYLKLKLHKSEKVEADVGVWSDQVLTEPRTVAVLTNWLNPQYCETQTLESVLTISFIYICRTNRISSNQTTSQHCEKQRSENVLTMSIIYVVPASCSLDDDFASRLCKIGLPYCAWNCFSVPKNPGIRKSNNDHNSNTLF